jgi:hypothetical protein
MWYHFAFLAISMTLMGSAMAGVVLYFFPRFTQPDVAQQWIGRASVAMAIAVPVIFLIYLRVPFRPVLMNREGAFSFEQLGRLALIYVLLTIPFFLSGSVLALTLAGWPNDAGKIYAADLVGAALGCLLSVAALAGVGGVNALFMLSLVLGAHRRQQGRRGGAVSRSLVVGHQRRNFRARFSPGDGAFDPHRLPPDADHRHGRLRYGRFPLPLDLEQGRRVGRKRATARHSGHDRT